jgi:GNAT superfamily N-acetyltransferase
MPTLLELHKGEFTLSSDPGRLDLLMIRRFLAESYWARRRPAEVVDRSLRNSLCFGVYRGPEQVGFARVVTDYSTFAYLADVFVLEQYRRRGLARWLVQSILDHPDLAGLRRWMLVTQDAQPLYTQCGFNPVRRPEEYMERLTPYPNLSSP